MLAPEIDSSVREIGPEQAIRQRGHIEALQREIDGLKHKIELLKGEVKDYRPTIEDFTSCTYLGEKMNRPHLAYAGMQTFCHLARMTTGLMPSSASEMIARAVSDHWPAIPISPFSRFMMAHQAKGLADMTFDYIRTTCVGMDVIQACYMPPVPPDIKQHLEQIDRKQYGPNNT